jgi:glycerol uptake facilitator-like aquaporin
MSAAFIYEVVGTFLFLVCILGVKQKGRAGRASQSG